MVADVGESSRMGVHLPGGWYVLRDVAERWELRRLGRAARWALLAVAVAGVGAWGQAAGNNVAANDNSTTPVTVSGRVVDGLHGTPVARALVRMGSRAVLTDALGRFSFAGATGARMYLSVTKPGYASENQSAEGTGAVLVSDAAVPAELVLVPDGVIAGVVTGPDGGPVAGAYVRILRVNYGADGLTPVQAGYAVTSASGEYRFREPAGAYRVTVSQVSSAAETGLMILPVDSPNESAGTAAGYWALAPGQERRVDLRAGGGMAVPVALHVTGAGAAGTEARGGMRAVVHLGSGVSFTTQAVGTGEDGIYQVKLPPGAYRVQLVSGGRSEVLEGSGRVTVGRGERAAVEIPMTPFTSLPVEIVANASPQNASSSTGPTSASVGPILGQLGLTLHPLEGAGGSAYFDGGDVRAQPRPDGNGYEFRVPAGRYRLTGTEHGGGWTVTGVSYGAGDLLGEELVVAGGSGGVPIRVTASNAVGQIAATVNLRDAAGAWVYLIPDAPRLAPETVTRVGLTGAYNANVAPGSYTLVAVAHRLEMDFHDAKAMARLKSAGSKVQVAEGGKATAQLELQTAGEATR